MTAHELENRDCLHSALVLKKKFNVREGSLKMALALPIFFFSPFSIRQYEFKNRRRNQEDVSNPKIENSRTSVSR